MAWCASEVGEPESDLQVMSPIEHAFTHFDLRLKPLRVRCRPHAGIKEGEQLWYPLGSPPKIGLPQPIKLLFERLRGGVG
jgi:A/G-specific adenine glycosylase